jgi:hypothetical protein
MLLQVPVDAGPDLPMDLGTKCLATHRKERDRFPACIGDVSLLSCITRLSED